MRGLSKGKHLQPLLILSSTKEHSLRRWLACRFICGTDPNQWDQKHGKDLKKKRRQIISFGGGGGKTKPILRFHLSSKLVHFFKMERHFIFVLHQIYYFFFNLLESSCFTMLLASTVQRSESAILTHTSPLFGFPSNLDQHRERSFLCCSVESQ